MSNLRKEGSLVFSVDNDYSEEWIPAFAGMTKLLAIIPVKLVPAKAGNGNPS